LHTLGRFEQPDGDKHVSQSLGWIGLGRMGEAMVKKLLQADPSQ
jgi:hypothetical protein